MDEQNNTTTSPETSAEPEKKDSAQSEKTFTQAEVDEIVNSRLAREKDKFKSSLRDEVEKDVRTIQGFQDGDMFSYTFKENKVNTFVDAQGAPAIAVNNNHLATVTINLTGNSVDHKYLFAIKINRNFIS